MCRWGNSSNALAREGRPRHVKASSATCRAALCRRMLLHPAGRPPHRAGAHMANSTHKGREPNQLSQNTCPSRVCPRTPPTLHGHPPPPQPNLVVELDLLVVLLDALRQPRLLVRQPVGLVAQHPDLILQQPRAAAAAASDRTSGWAGGQAGTAAAGQAGDSTASSALASAALGACT